MIRKLTKQDEASVLDFLYEEPEINLYIIGDIKNFGFDQEDQAIYAEFKDGDYYAVVSRNLSHIVYYAKEATFNPMWVDIFNQFDYLFISGKAPLMKAIAPYFPDLWVDKLEFMKSTTFIKDDDISYDKIQFLKNEKDAEKVYALLNQIDELDSVTKKSKEEFITYLLDNSDDNGTTVFIEEDNQVIASASAVGETKKTAMIVGVATHEDYRKQGLGKTVLHYLVDLYVNQKKKTLCLYYDDKRAGALYEKLGFVPLDEWIMLIPKHD
ncbi:MAG: GNAT family N-acetyltransferase [Candidatus Izemoplasmataceae bacterium]